MIKKVVILGPESTGKSTLCTQLAAHFKTNWVKEYARKFLVQHGRNYTFDNLLAIAKGQLKSEEEAIGKLQSIEVSIPFNEKNPLIFIDTDMYVLKVWCEFVFDQCHQWILNQIVERRYDLYLLCDIDLPWIKDELREYPDLATREKLYHHYKDIMVNQNVPWVNISGNYEQRLQKAIDAVNQIN